MVILKFEKPSTWFFGQKAGALAVILLFIGPFLPYWGREYINGDTASVVYADINTFGLLFLLPLVSALLIILLMFLKFNIYIKDELEHKKINHFILMIWGFVFFLIYLADVIRAARYSTSYYYQFAGFGLWFIVLGFFLCTLAGYFEWQKPHMIGPQILIKRKAIANAVSSDGGSSKPASKTILVTSNLLLTQPEVDDKQMKTDGETQIKSSHNPLGSKRRQVTMSKKPRSSEEATMIRWLEHVSDNGKTFEQCIKCNTYAFFTIQETESSFIFKCGECKTSFTLNK